MKPLKELVEGKAKGEVGHPFASLTAVTGVVCIHMTSARSHWPAQNCPPLIGEQNGGLPSLIGQSD